MRMGLGAVAALAVALLAVGCGGDDGDGDSESSTLSAAESSTDEPASSEESGAADTTAPTVKARAAKAAVGEPVALRFSVTDESGSTRENITIWKGQKRQQLIARKAFEPTPESGDERTTTLEVAELGKWKSKPGKYRWCVRAFDEAGNKSKVACANLTITKAGSGGSDSQGSTAEEPATSTSDATSSEDATTGDATTDDGGSSDGGTSSDGGSSEDDGSTG